MKKKSILTLKRSHVDASEYKNNLIQTDSEGINKLTDNKWVITDLDGSGPFEITWNELMETNNQSLLLDAKLLYRAWNTVHALPNGELKARPSVSNRFRTYLARLFHYMDLIGCKSLSELTSKDILDCYAYTLDKRRSAPGQYRKIDASEVLLSHRFTKEFDQYMHILREHSHRYGKAFTNSIPSLNDYLKVAKAKCKHYGIDYIEWLKGGSLDKVGVALGLMHLGYALDVLRSDKTRCMVALCRAIHKCEKLPPASNLNDMGRSLVPPKKFYSENQSGPFESNKPNGHSVKRYNNEFFTNLRSELLAEFETSSIHDLPFKPNELPIDVIQPNPRRYNLGPHNDLIKSITAAALVVFLCLSGARKSELGTLRVKDILTDDQDTKYFDTVEKAIETEVQFDSKIHKTNHSIPTRRDISGFLLEAYRVLIDCSANKKLDDDYLFSFAMFAKSSKANDTRYKGLRINQCNKSVSEHLRNHFLVPFSKTVSADIATESLKSVPHGYRHFFFEFSLRRFDGNVREFLRDHFRHNFNSYMINNYSSNKILENTEIQQVHREYILELVGREHEAMLEDRKELFGPIGEWIRKRVSELRSYSKEELETVFEEIADEFGGEVDPHEYGFCLVKKNTATQSKCYDPITKLPKTTEASWDLCGGCAHRLTLSNHRETILRLGISAKQMSSDLEDSGVPFLAAPFQKALDLAEKALRDIDGDQDV